MINYLISDADTPSVIDRHPWVMLVAIVAALWACACIGGY